MRCYWNVDLYNSGHNLNSENKIIFDENTEFLNECINENGNLAEAFGIEPYFEIISGIKEFISFKWFLFIYVCIGTKWKRWYLWVTKRGNRKKKKFKYKKFCFVEETNINGNEETLLLNKLNNEIEQCNIFNRWSFSCETEFPSFKEEWCSSSLNDNIYI